MADFPISFEIFTAKRRGRRSLSVKMISICYTVLFIAEMWGRKDDEEDVSGERRSVNRRREYAEFRRWLGEE